MDLEAYVAAVLQAADPCVAAGAASALAAAAVVAAVEVRAAWDPCEAEADIGAAALSPIN